MKCRTCKNPIDKTFNRRLRYYCSVQCRTRYHNHKHLQYQKLWQRRRYDRQAVDNNDCRPKVKCLYCGRWYVQVGSHIVARHKQTAREYREDNQLEVKRGIVPAWYRKLKGDQAISNQTYKNLKAGQRYWYKKNQRGIGKYKRSPITMKRLSKLYLYARRYKGS